MKTLTLIVAALACAVLATGCATKIGRVMEAPVDNIDVAEVAANLQPGMAMMYSHRYQSLQPNSTTTLGNDSALTTAAAKELIGFGVGLASAPSAASAVLDRDRVAESALVIAKSEHIRDMRVSDNKAALIQQAKVVDVINNVTLVQGLDDDLTVGIATNPPAASPEPAPAPAPEIPLGPDPDPNASLDAISIAGAKLLGVHKNVDPAKARITDVLVSVTVNPGGIILDYQTNGWPDNDSGVGDNIDGRVYIYWFEGQEQTGGHFEWKRPGQTERSFSNILNGYLEGKKPPRGADLYFVLASNKGDRRTNVVKAEGVWP